MIDFLKRAERSGKPLRRELKSRHLQLIALGSIIGSGYFLGTAEALRTVGPAAVLAYVFGGIWAQVGSLSFMAMSDSLRDPLLLGIPALLVPMILYAARKSRLG